MMAEFFMCMVPPTVTAQEHQVTVRNGRPVFFDPPELKAARAKLVGSLARHSPGAPLQGPVRLIVKWCFPRGSHRDGEYRATKPDTDNLQKLLKDCMTKTGFWQDDAQVASEIAEKFWAEIPGIWIRVSQLDPSVETEAETETGAEAEAEAKAEAEQKRGKKQA